MGFLLCVMPGPVAIEVFHHAVKKENKHALSIGLGAGVGDGIWALVAFYGITPFLENGGNHLESIFLIIAAVFTFIIGVLAIKDSRLVEKVEKKEEKIIEKVEKVARKRKRWSLLKGLTMVLVNPLGIGSWMIVLSFLKKTSIYIPVELSFVIFFFTMVTLGAFSYSLVMVVITSRIKTLFDDHEKTAKIVKILGYTLIVFSFYFIFHATRVFLLGKP